MLPGLQAATPPLTTGARAMAVALTLAAAGHRHRNGEDGRWKRGTVPVGSNGSVSSWAQRMKEAGVVLDHAPELAPDVIAGDTAPSAARHRR